MAKAYLTQNKRKGSVGGETYSIVKGQTIVKAKPVSVSNPRTYAQMGQRSLFLDAVKFFQHSNQSYFKMAFESKKSTESDYNAFMRINAKNGVNITKAMADDVRFAALGEWVVTSGSLPSAQLTRSAGGYSLSLPSMTTSDLTIGALSSRLISDYGLQAGDIFTLVQINTAMADVDESTLEVTYIGDFSPEWTIKQFVIDESNLSGIADVLGNNVVPDSGMLSITNMSSYCGGAFISFSRNTDTGLKVSTTKVIANTLAYSILEKMKDASFVAKVLVDWGANSGAVLQGNEVNTDIVSISGAKGADITLDSAMAMTASAKGAALVNVGHRNAYNYVVLQGTNLGELDSSKFELTSTAASNFTFEHDEETDTYYNKFEIGSDIGDFTVKYDGEVIYTGTIS